MKLNRREHERAMTRTTFQLSVLKTAESLNMSNRDVLLALNELQGRILRDIGKKEPSERVGEGEATLDAPRPPVV